MCAKSSATRFDPVASLNMDNNSKNRDALEACLTEYSALRDEELLLIRWRHNLMFASVASAGAIFSFALATPIARQIGPPSGALALYLIAPICALSGLVWIDATWAMYRLAFYVEEVLSVQVNALIFGPRADASGDGAVTRVFGWEGSLQRTYSGPGARFVNILGFVGSFIGPGIISQILILSGSPGSIHERMSKLDIRSLYLLNWTFVAITLCVAIAGYIVKTRRVSHARKHWLSR